MSRPIDLANAVTNSVAPRVTGPGPGRPPMLEHLGHADAARAVVAAIERVVAEGKVLTRDLGG